MCGVLNSQHVQAVDSNKREMAEKKNNGNLAEIGAPKTIETQS